MVRMWCLLILRGPSQPGPWVLHSWRGISPASSISLPCRRLALLWKQLFWWTSCLIIQCSPEIQLDHCNLAAYYLGLVASAKVVNVSILRHFNSISPLWSSNALRLLSSSFFGTWMVSRCRCPGTYVEPDLKSGQRWPLVGCAPPQRRQTLPRRSSSNPASGLSAWKKQSTARTREPTSRFCHGFLTSSAYERHIHLKPRHLHRVSKWCTKHGDRPSLMAW